MNDIESVLPADETMHPSPRRTPALASDSPGFYILLFKPLINLDAVTLQNTPAPSPRFGEKGWGEGFGQPLFSTSNL